ncbi:MAG: hypothetical protein E2O81_01465 [Betaproteobacteria bacterium]|nr:MAG: hypothetical protein E2O81_01465 [Betaproteobacteria bacterium]TDI82046.1 MAG: hypothetical protein E2O80_03190 [Betaproteobacteria bacterium]
MVIGKIFYLFNCCYLLASAISWKGFLDNRNVLIAIIVFVIIQLIVYVYARLCRIFLAQPPLISAWIRIVAFGILLFTVIEIEKCLIRKKN